MPTTTNMSLVIPTEDASDDLWDTILNTALEAIDAHDHTTGKGLRVPSAGLNINADLSFGSFAATAVKAMDLAPVAAATVAGYTTALFVSSADNELYWRTSGGVNVKVTDGSSLNASLLGGFAGDYGAGAEEAEFSSGTGIYNFLVAATERGYIDCSDIRLFEKTAGITNAVKLKSPAALAASYTVTFPGAAPASTSIVQMSSAGVLTASPSGNVATSGTVATGALTVTGAAAVSTTLGVTGAATLGSAAVTGAATVGTTLGVTGLITATAGLTAAANQHVTVSGTGQHKHGDRTVVVPGCAFQSNQSNVVYDPTSCAVGINSGTNCELTAPIPLPAGKRITQLKWTVSHGTGTGTRTYAMKTHTLATNVAATVVTEDRTTSNSYFQFTDSSAQTLAADTCHYLYCLLNESGDQIVSCEITYDEP